MSGKMPNGTPWSVPDGLEDIYDKSVALWDAARQRAAPLIATVRHGLDELGETERQRVAIERAALAPRPPAPALRGSQSPDEVRPAPAPAPLAEGEWYWPATGHDVLTVRGGGQGDGAYHTPRSDGRTHLGIDIAMPVGTPLYADRDGVVQRLDRRDAKGYGLQLELGPDSRNRSKYAHLNYAYVNVGQQVKRGDLVGISGKSGNAKSLPVPHLHYETFVDGERVDPTANYPGRRSR